MEEKKKMYKLILLFILCSTCFSAISYGNESVNFQGESDLQKERDLQDYSNVIDYSEVDEVTESLLEGVDIEMPGFFEMVKQLASGQDGFSLGYCIKVVTNAIFGEVAGSGALIREMLFIAIIAAMFSTLANSFSKNGGSEAGFTVTYLMMFVILTGTFKVAMDIGTSAASGMTDFMKGLVPAYITAVTLSSGSGSGLVFYQGTTILITVAQIAVVNLIIPMINIYAVLILANSISKEDTFSKMAKLIKSSIKALLKSLTAAMIGINTIQGMLVPVLDSLKAKIAENALSTVPIVGNTLNSVAGTVVGSAVLIKNSIGVAGVIVLLVIILFPLVKLITYKYMYKGMGAILQPISDKRIVDALTGMGEAADLLAKAVFTTVLLFVLTIAIVAFTTNARYYAG